MSEIALFLDVDGVLNQYNNHERMRRFKIGYNCTFEPFQKKVLRLAKLVKKYNLDVYVFSAWAIEDLQPHLPFQLKGDTRKWVKNVHEIATQYQYSLLIDDEVSCYCEIGKDQKQLDNSIHIYQPDYNYGLVLKDFKNIDRILKGLKNGRIL